jgi:O-antigen ligase
VLIDIKKIKIATTVMFLSMAWHFSFNGILFREIVINIAVWFILITIIKYKTGTDFFIIDADRLLLTGFAVLLVISGITFSIDTEIPRYKNFLRAVLYLYTILLTTKPSGQLKTESLYLFTMLIFSSFQFQWAYTIGELKSLPLFILSGVIVYDTSVRREKNIPIYILLLLFLIPVILLVSNIVNRNMLHGFEEFFIIVAALSAFYTVFHRVKEDHFLFLINVFTFLYSLYFVVTMAIKIVTDADYNLFIDKPSFIGGVNVNDISGYYILVLPFVLAFFGNSVRFASLNLASVLFILAAVKSRFPIIVCAVIILLYVSFGTENFIRKNRKKILFGIFAIALFFLSVFSFFYSNKLEYLTSRDSLDTRGDMWIFAWNAICENLLFGTGVNNNIPLLVIDRSFNIDAIPMLADVFEEGGRFTHAHSTFLQLWLNGGILYVIFYFTFTLFALYRGFKNKQNKIVFASFLAVTAFLLEGLLNYHLMSHSFLLILWMAFAVIFKNSNILPEFKQNKSAPAMAFLFFTITISLTAVLAIHAAAMNHIRTIRGWDNYDNLILQGNMTPQSVGNLDAAEKLSGSLYNSSLPERKFCQQYAEIKYYRYTIDKTPENLTSAHSAYTNCLDSRFKNPIVYYRLFETDITGNAREYLLQSEKYDSFHLLNQWIHHY